MKNDAFQKDLYRFYGEKGPTLAQRITPPYELLYIKRYRRAKARPKSLICRWLLRSISKKTQIQIPPMVDIGPGFHILHFGRIVINHHVKGGKNLSLSPGVLIGQEERGKRRGSPTIGNDVWVGTNAVIVGRITIGDDVLIAPNAFVNFDVPSHSIVVGNPGRIIPREHATEGYIKNPIE